ncbi:hypothetical protein FOXB_06987 [Fusarium oxysporum f. sp. conglutinans Fo5176]|uniref:Uncharacterized protein n=1 Tax=Fusarium oxysporum (strain Fo5176) TaxID=660025 RepID=F9FKQ8_FUSOF|nr:hypothetical protein FOXB_06987 [Fusarium oxysporum f. sp. conglutinans Fo5176]
MAQDREARYK